MERTMKKILLSLLFASLGLGGCVAVPVNGGGYAPAPAVVVAPPAVVVRPWFYGSYGGGRGYYR
jgi:hypothetical protein